MSLSVYQVINFGKYILRISVRETLYESVETFLIGIQMLPGDLSDHASQDHFSIEFSVLLIFPRKCALIKKIGGGGTRGT